jgi:transposase-like protein
MRCPNCGEEMVKIGYHTNKRGKWQRYKCMNCGTTKTDFSINLKA